MVKKKEKLCKQWVEQAVPWKSYLLEGRQWKESLQKHSKPIMQPMYRRKMHNRLRRQDVSISLTDSLG
ncbi:hypothetical protein IC582_014353 [Cucumis melo]